MGGTRTVLKGHVGLAPAAAGIAIEVGAAEDGATLDYSDLEPIIGRLRRLGFAALTEPSNPVRDLMTLVGSAAALAAVSVVSNSSVPQPFSGLLQAAGVGLTAVGIASMRPSRAVLALRRIPTTLKLFVGAASALPALLPLAGFVFITGDAWKLLGGMPGINVAATLITISLIALAVILRHRPGVVVKLESTHVLKGFVDDAAMASMLEALPEAARLRDRGIEPASDLSALEVRERRAFRRVAVMGAVGGVVTGAVLMMSVFVLFGFLTVDRDETAQYLAGVHGTDPRVLLSVAVGGQELVVTTALLKVAGLLSAFAALFFVIATFGRESDRENFLGALDLRLRQALVCWAFYKPACAVAGPEPSRRGTAAFRPFVRAHRGTLWILGFLLLLLIGGGQDLTDSTQDRRTDAILMVLCTAGAVRALVVLARDWIAAQRG